MTTTATPAPTTVKLRCTSLNESGVNSGIVAVTFVQISDGSANAYGSNLTLQRTAEEAKSFFPGQTYDLALSPSA